MVCRNVTWQQFIGLTNNVITMLVWIKILAWFPSRRGTLNIIYSYIFIGALAVSYEGGSSRRRLCSREETWNSFCVWKQINNNRTDEQKPSARRGKDNILSLLHRVWFTAAAEVNVLLLCFKWHSPWRTSETGHNKAAAAVFQSEPAFRLLIDNVLPQVGSVGRWQYFFYGSVYFIQNHLWFQSQCVCGGFILFRFGSH